MELGTREILLAVGLLLIVVIVWDGIRRIRQSGHGQIRMARRQRVFDEDDDGSYDPYGGELPSGVRVRERDAREAPMVRSRGPVRPQPAVDDEDDPLLRPATRTRREPGTSRPVRGRDAAFSAQPADIHGYDELPFDEEEQHELVLDMPQQEALNLGEDTEREPPLTATRVRRRRDQAAAPAEAFEQDGPQASQPRGVRHEDLHETPESVSATERPDLAETTPAVERNTAARQAPAARKAPPRQREPAGQRVPAGQRAPAAQREPRDDGPMPEVIALHVMAHDGHFRGNDLLDEFMANDLRYGSMKIFHRHQDEDGVGPVLFSVANSVKPGTFDLNAMDEFSTPGISLFMALDDLKNPTDAFEQLLGVAHNLAAGLGGDLKDESRSALTRQTEDHCRQRIKEFERRRLYRTTPL